MTVTSLGDLSSNLQLRRDTSRIKGDLQRLTRELSSGVADNLVGRFKGNFSPLNGVERGIARAESYLVAIAEHQLSITGQQTALANLASLGDIAGPLMSVQDTGDAVLVRNAGHDALSRLSSALSNLNVQSGGRTIFSGVALDGPVVADADTILSAIETEIAAQGAVTATAVAQVVTDFFAVGGGYDTVGYLGGAVAASGPQLSDGEVAGALVTAQDEGVRDYLAGFAMAGLLGRGVLSGDTGEQGRLARLSGEHLHRATSGLVDLQARIGTAEGQIARAKAEVMAESEGLRIARTKLIGADPYETAVDLQMAETQLRTLYTITARLSRLSLTDYL